MRIRFEQISKSELSELEQEASEVPFLVDGVELRFRMARGKVLGVEFGSECSAREVPEEVTLAGNFSPFRMEVWQALTEIERSTTLTYSELAARVGRPSAVRAVASTVASNPFAYIVPCHRIVPAHGAPGRYRWGASLKARLLALEQAQK